MKMQTIKPNTNWVSSNYFYSLSLGLRIFAEANKEFNTFLQSIRENFGEYKYSFVENEEFTNGVRLLIPPHLIAAKMRLEWLIKNMKTQKNNVTETLANILFSECPAVFVAPKSPIWGLKYTRKYGPAFGDMISDRTTTTQVVLLHSSCNNWKKFELAKAIHYVGTGVLSECFKKANYSFENLEPEVSDWLLGDREIEVYIVNDDNQFREALEEDRSRQETNSDFQFT